MNNAVASTLSSIELIYTNDDSIVIPSKFIRYLNIEKPNNSYNRTYIDYDGCLHQENLDELVSSFTLLLHFNKKFFKYLRKWHKEKYPQSNFKKRDVQKLVDYWFKRKDISSYILHTNDMNDLCEREFLLPFLYKVKNEYTNDDLININEYNSYWYGLLNDKKEFLYCVNISSNMNPIIRKNIQQDLMKDCILLDQH